MNEDVLDVMKEHNDPFLTLGEISAELGVTKKAVEPRLDELEAENKIERKKVGARAVVWWIPKRERGYASD